MVGMKAYLSLVVWGFLPCLGDRCNSRDVHNVPFKRGRGFHPRPLSFLGSECGPVARSRTEVCLRPRVFPGRGSTRVPGPRPWPPAGGRPGRTPGRSFHCPAASLYSRDRVTLNQFPVRSLWLVQTAARTRPALTSWAGLLFISSLLIRVSPSWLLSPGLHLGPSGRCIGCARLTTRDRALPPRLRCSRGSRSAARARLTGGVSSAAERGVAACGSPAVEYEFSCYWRLPEAAVRSSGRSVVLESRISTRRTDGWAKAGVRPFGRIASRPIQVEDDATPPRSGGTPETEGVRCRSDERKVGAGVDTQCRFGERRLMRRCPHGSRSSAASSDGTRGHRPRAVLRFAAALARGTGRRGVRLLLGGEAGTSELVGLVQAAADFAVRAAYHSADGRNPTDRDPPVERVRRALVLEELRIYQSDGQAPAVLELARIAFRLLNAVEAHPGDSQSLTQEAASTAAHAVMDTRCAAGEESAVSLEAAEVADLRAFPWEGESFPPLWAARDAPCGAAEADAASPLDERPRDRVQSVREVSKREQPPHRDEPTLETAQLPRPTVPAGGGSNKPNFTSTRAGGTSSPVCRAPAQRPHRTVAWVVPGTQTTRRTRVAALVKDLGAVLLLSGEYERTPRGKIKGCTPFTQSRSAASTPTQPVLKSGPPTGRPATSPPTTVWPQLYVELRKSAEPGES